MSLSTQNIRDEFKTHIKQWGDEAQKKNAESHILFEIHRWSENIEKVIQEKVRLLETDFNDYPLKGEYLRTVSEGFDDLDRLLKNQKTFLDVTKGKNIFSILDQIQHHYTNYLIPLLNIMAKLENDYISIATQALSEKAKKTLVLETQIRTLNEEKFKIKKRFFGFNNRNKYITISKKIRTLETQRKIAHLALAHIELNLYYFNHDRPYELRLLKERADKLRTKLYKLQLEPEEEKQTLHAAYTGYKKAIDAFLFATRSHQA